MKRVEWAAPALQDLAALDKALARRVKVAIERFALTGTGDVKKLQGIDPPEFRLRIGEWRVRFELAGDVLRICESAIGKMPIDKASAKTRSITPPPDAGPASVPPPAALRPRPRLRSRSIASVTARNAGPVHGTA